MKQIVNQSLNVDMLKVTPHTALQTVLMADAKRTELLKEESDLLAAQNKGKGVHSTPEGASCQRKQLGRLQ